jgi:hypothetical protein
MFFSKNKVLALIVGLLVTKVLLLYTRVIEGLKNSSTSDSKTSEYADTNIRFNKDKELIGYVNEDNEFALYDNYDKTNDKNGCPKGYSDVTEDIGDFNDFDIVGKKIPLDPRLKIIDPIESKGTCK